MRRLSDVEVYAIGERVTQQLRHGVEGMDRENLLRLRAAMRDDQVSALANNIVSVYESARGLGPEQLIGPGKLVSREAQSNAIAAACLMVYECLQAMTADDSEGSDG